MEVHVGPKDMEPLVVEPGCRCCPGIDGGIEVAVLQEGSRGSAPGSVREDEVAVLSWKQRLS